MGAIDKAQPSVPLQGEVARETGLPVADLLCGLIAEGRVQRGPDALLVALCRRLLAQGLPLLRASFHLQTLHPLLRARSFVWSRESEDVAIADHGHETLDQPGYLHSPLRPVFDGAGALRCRLDAEPPQLDYPITVDLKRAGATDYVVMPLRFGDGTVNAVTWATDRPGGFTGAELAGLDALLAGIALLLEVAMVRTVAATVLETYIGRDAARRVLAGEITRGQGHTLHAALWYCDMRNFTPLSETLPRDVLIGLLDDYFDCMAKPVQAAGGEVLKFLGDGMLAVFPCGGGQAACDAVDRALAAATEALAAIEARNATGDGPRIETGIALHIGDVMYGNIGAADRLDFTVIGPAVNRVARVEDVCRETRINLLTTAEFAAASTADLVSVGCHALRGIEGEQELFTPRAMVPGGRGSGPAPTQAVTA